MLSLMTFSELKNLQSKLNIELYKRASLSLIPTEIITDILFKYLTHQERVNVLIALYKDKFNYFNVYKTFIRERIIIETYNHLYRVRDSIFTMCFCNFYFMDFPLHVFINWSPFSKTKPMPIASIFRNKRIKINKREVVKLADKYSKKESRIFCLHIYSSIGPNSTRKMWFNLPNKIFTIDISKYLANTFNIDSQSSVPAFSFWIKPTHPSQ